MDPTTPQVDMALPPRRPWRHPAAVAVILAAVAAGYVALGAAHDAGDAAPSFQLALGLVLGALLALSLWLVRRSAVAERRLFDAAAELHRRRAQLDFQRELIEAEGRHRLTLEHAPEALLLADAHGAVISANLAAEALFASPPGALLGRALAECVASSEREALRELLIAPAGATTTLRATALRLDGDTFAAELLLRAQAAGEAALRIVAVRDVSRWLDAQRRLERSHQDALARERAKADLVATLSHEIRTPLNGILGMVRLLEEEELSAEPRELVRHVHASAQALIATLEDVLQASKLNAGALVLEATPFDLLELAEDVLVLHHEAADRKGLRLIVACTGDLQRQVVGDPQRIRQVLSNLVNNAIKFTYSGYVKVSLATRRIGARAISLALEVEDTGVGIPSDKLEHVFERFTRLQSGSGRMVEGTGLGLAIAREIARLMGGDVSASSPGGGGARFTFTGQLESAVPAAAGPALPGVAGARVLVTLAARAEREAVAAFLASHGAIAVGAASGAQALEQLEAGRVQGRPFGVVLADKELIDLEAASFAALASSAPGLRLALVARLADRVRPEQAAALGAWRIVRRPILLSRLLALIASSGAEPAPATSPSPRPRAVVQELAPLLARHVLVVEDNPTNQKVAEIMIRKLGCQVTLASDGRQALELVRQGDFELIFMDCQMPEIDGYDTTREIRSWGGPFAKLPIIALTANAIEGDRDRSLAAGMNDHLTKPVTRDGFREALTRWLPHEAHRAAS